MYKLIENEESVYKVIMKEENSIRSEHTGKVLKEYKFESTFKEYVDDSAFSKRFRNFLDKSKEIPFEIANNLAGQYLVKNYNYSSSNSSMDDYTTNTYTFTIEVREVEELNLKKLLINDKEYEVLRYSEEIEKNNSIIINTILKLSGQEKDTIINLQNDDQFGYEIKYGKHISFKKIDGQQRFTRAMRIGENYTEERLKERILEEVGMKIKRTKASFKPLDNVIDINANDKVKSSPGYKYWATKHNLSTMADTINQVRSEGFKTREQLEKALYEKAAEVQNLLTENKEIEKLIEVKKNIMENRYIIEQYKEIYKYAKSHPEDKAFINEYSPQLMLYKKIVTQSFLDSDVIPTTKQIYEDLEKLHTKKESLIEKLNQARQEQDRLYQYKKNYDNYLGKEVER